MRFQGDTGMMGFDVKLAPVLANFCQLVQGVTLRSSWIGVQIACFRLFLSSSVTTLKWDLVESVKKTEGESQTKTKTLSFSNRTQFCLIFKVARRQSYLHGRGALLSVYDAQKPSGAESTWGQNRCSQATRREVLTFEVTEK